MEGDEREVKSKGDREGGRGERGDRGGPEKDGGEKKGRDGEGGWTGVKVSRS